MSKAVITESGKVGFIIGSGDTTLEYTKPDGSIDKVVEEFEVETTVEEATKISNMSRKKRLVEAKKLAKRGYTKV